MEESSYKKMFLRKNIRIVFFDKIKHLTFAKRGNTHFKKDKSDQKNITSVFVVNKQRFSHDFNSKISR